MCRARARAQAFQLAYPNVEIEVIVVDWRRTGLGYNPCPNGHTNTVVVRKKSFDSHSMNMDSYTNLDPGTLGVTPIVGGERRTLVVGLHCKCCETGCQMSFDSHTYGCLKQIPANYRPMLPVLDDYAVPGAKWMLHRNCSGRVEMNSVNDNGFEWLAKVEKASASFTGTLCQKAYRAALVEYETNLKQRAATDDADGHQARETLVALDERKAATGRKFDAFGSNFELYLFVAPSPKWLANAVHVRMFSRRDFWRRSLQTIKSEHSMASDGCVPLGRIYNIKNAPDREMMLVTQELGYLRGFFLTSDKSWATRKGAFEYLGSCWNFNPMQGCIDDVSVARLLPFRARLTVSPSPRRCRAMRTRSRRLSPASATWNTWPRTCTTSRSACARIIRAGDALTHLAPTLAAA